MVDDQHLRRGGAAMAASNQTNMRARTAPLPVLIAPGLPPRATARDGLRPGACHASKFSYNPALARFGWRLNGEPVSRK